LSVKHRTKEQISMYYYVFYPKKIYNYVCVSCMCTVHNTHYTSFFVSHWLGTTKLPHMPKFWLTSFLVRAHSHQDPAQDLAYPATRRTGAPELGDPHARGAFIQRWGQLGQGSDQRGKVLAGASSSPWGQDQGHEELGAGGLSQWAQDHEVEVCRQCYEQFLFCGVRSLRARHLHQVLCWQCGNDKQPVHNTRVLNDLILFKTFIGLNYLQFKLNYLAS